MNAKYQDGTLHGFVTHSCGHEEHYHQGYRQTELGFQLGMEKKQDEPCFECKIVKENEERKFWRLIRDHLIHLRSAL